MMFETRINTNSMKPHFYECPIFLGCIMYVSKCLVYMILRHEHEKSVFLPEVRDTKQEGVPREELS